MSDTLMGLPFGPDLLFVPGDQPERYAKAAERASGVIIDLEDGVDPSQRDAARAALTASSLDPARTIVRVSPAGTDAHVHDVNAVRRTAYRYVMVAKSGSASDVSVSDGWGRPYDVLALIETAEGVVRADEIAATQHVVALMWGAEDLVASTGGTASRDADGGYRELARYARVRTLLAAKAFGKSAIDAVQLDLKDHDSLAAEARDAVTDGFDAKAVLHPDQAAVVRGAFAPGQDEILAARAVLDAAAGRRGAFALEGRMVDEVVLTNARTVLRRAGLPTD